MKTGRDIIGYNLGLILFIILIPLIMWKASGSFSYGVIHIIVLVAFGAIGIALSIWSIVYMKLVGKGNPMDALRVHLLSWTRNIPAFLASNFGFCAVLCHHDGAGKQGRKTSGTGLRRSVHRV